jgi:hypothetical protein
MPDRSIIVLLLGVLAGAAGAAVLALLRVRERRTRSSRTADVPKPPDTLAPEVRREFAEVAHKFSGLYESLHRVCVVGPDPEECRLVLSEWEVRLTYGSADALRREWESLVREATDSTKFGNGDEVDDKDTLTLAAAWLDLLHKCGIERDERTRFELDEIEKRRYRISGTHPVGELVEVELPCWTYDGAVIEQGIARSVATQN